MTATAVILKDDVVTLTPSEDKDYLYSLVTKYQYNTVEDKDKAFEWIDRYVNSMWEVSSKGIRGGMIFIMYFPEFDQWTMDAYADMEVAKSVNPKGDFSYRAGKLVMDFFFSNSNSHELATMHDIRNRAATIMCKRLGFKEDGYIELIEIGKHIVMKISKDLWELKRRFN